MKARGASAVIGGKQQRIVLRFQSQELLALLSMKKRRLR